MFLYNDEFDFFGCEDFFHQKNEIGVRKNEKNSFKNVKMASKK